MFKYKFQLLNFLTYQITSIAPEYTTEPQRHVIHQNLQSTQLVGEIIVSTSLHLTHFNGLNLLVKSPSVYHNFIVTVH